MEIITREMPDNYILIDSGDWHIGPLSCYIKGFKQMVERVKKTKNAFLFGKGDMIDCILPNDKRFASCIMGDNALLTPQQQADEVITLLSPIKKKILGLLIGNHEYKIINTFNVGRYIADSLVVPFGGVCTKFTATKKGKVRHKMFFIHGRKVFNSQSKDQLQRLANQKAALKLYLVETKITDSIYMSAGHAHKILAVDPTAAQELMLTDDGHQLQQQYRVSPHQDSNYIPPDCRWFGCSGSFLRTYAPSGSDTISYAEMAGYGPSEMGWLEVHVKKGEVQKIERVVVG